MTHIGENIASAAIEAGLPSTSVDQFVSDLLAENNTALFTIKGVTPKILGAGADALLDTYATGFRNVWVSALAPTVLAGVGISSYPQPWCHFTNSWEASLFLFDPREKFDNHIDSPVEKDEDLYSVNLQSINLQA